MKIAKSMLSQIVVIGIIIFILFSDYFNPIKEYLPILWSVLIVLSILYKIKYRNGKTTKELRFTVKNDGYNKLYPFIIGAFLLLVGICAFLSIKQYYIFTSLIVLNGILFIISGFLFVPGGVLYFEKNTMKFKNGNQENSIETEQLINLCLHKDKIIFTDKLLKKYNLLHLNLNQKELKNITDFMHQNLGAQIGIQIHAINNNTSN
jgi:hypothetical protein